MEPVPPLPYARVPVTSAVRETLAQVATPAPFKLLTNWLVQEVPAYADATPDALVVMREDWMDETVRLVVEAFEAVMAVVDAYGKVLAAVADEVMTPAKVLAVVEVAVKKPASALLPRSDEPVTDSALHGVEVAIPTKPALVMVVVAVPPK